MGFGEFYKGEKKKKKKGGEVKQQPAGNSSFVLPQIEIIRKGKKDQ